MIASDARVYPTEEVGAMYAFCVEQLRKKIGTGPWPPWIQWGVSHGMEAREVVEGLEVLDEQLK